MSLFRLVNKQSAEAHEDVFLSRYERLLAWALPLTEGEEAAAEDLVHDAFIQFTLSRPDLDAIENLDAYLRRMLRNLRVSQGRRAAQKRERPLCSADYDSAELSLRAEEIHAGLGAREELSLVCQYALARRHSSKAASALILRFFHGYLPAEIARVMRLDEAAGRGAVKQWLSLARREARQYMHDPQSLRFIGQAPADNAPMPPIPRAGTGVDFLQALRAAIFAAPQPQTCLSVRRLNALYRDPQAEPIDSHLLAHLVCCARCLEVVNSRLGLDSLTDRFPGGPGGAASGAQGGRGLEPERARSREALRAESRRRREEPLEQRPAELHVYANGFCVAAHSVEAARNRLSLKIHLDEPLAFIEVFSEQGVRLLYLQVDEPSASGLKQTTRLELGERRTLEATLNFASQWPTLELNYSDCGLRIADCGLDEIADSPLTLFASFAEPRGPLAKLKSVIRNLKSTIGFRNSQSAIRNPQSAVLLTLLLIAVVVGQKLGWRLMPAKPAALPIRREAHPGEAALERQPSSSPVAAGAANPVAPPTITPATPIIATAELELEALRLLRQAKADTHEQIEVRRSPRGKLRIEGLLDTEARKAELLQALSPLRGHPAVEIQLQTVAEAAARERLQEPRPSARPVAVVERDEIAATRLPVDAELRRHFAASGITEERLDEEIRRFAALTLARSRQAARYAGALRSLTARFADGAALDSTARKKWRRLLSEHARALRGEIGALEDSLTPVFAAPSHGAGDEVVTLKSDADLRGAVERIASICAETDHALIAAFSISSDSTPADVIKAPGFWLNLQRGERLAEAINQYLSTDQ